MPIIFGSPDWVRGVQCPPSLDPLTDRSGTQETLRVRPKQGARLFRDRHREAPSVGAFVGIVLGGRGDRVPVSDGSGGFGIPDGPEPARLAVTDPWPSFEAETA